MTQFVVEFFEKSDGSFPVEKFILLQEVKMRAKIFRTLQLLEIKGNNLREPYTKSLGDGIFEIRVKQSNQIARILYFFVVGNRVILTNGFIKKTQKTPKNEIDRAKKYRQEFLDRRDQDD